MIHIRLSDTDFKHIRFRYSPIMELVMSFRLFIRGNAPDVYENWLVAAKKTFKEENYPCLRTLVLPEGYLPDFLTPSTPDATDIRGAWRQIKLTPAKTVRNDLDKLASLPFSNDRHIERLSGNIGSFVNALVEEMERYWNDHLLIYWSRISNMLEREIHFQSYQAGIHGYEHIFSRLHRNIRYSEDTFRIEKKHSFSVSLDGDGITLIPLFFSLDEPLVICDVPGQTTVFFPIKDNSIFAKRSRIMPDTQLRLLIGGSKSVILKHLEIPATTTDLATVMRTTPSAVCQHLQSLHTGSLVGKYRTGKRTYYFLTKLGLQVVQLYR